MTKTIPQRDEDFWAQCAAELKWRTPWHTTFAGNFAQCKWFDGGKLNVTETCLDEHLEKGRSSKPAIIWESEDGQTQSLSYRELFDEVLDLSRGLRALGAAAGDRIAIYMPLCPKAVVAMLACARIGAPHTVVFAGFSSQSLAERIDDSQCRFVITADGFLRKGQITQLKNVVDEALAKSEIKSVEKVIVLKHRGLQIDWSPTIDVEWESCVRSGISGGFSDAPEIVDSEHLLFILYTSGTTGKPKGIMHSCGGYLAQVRSTCKSVFDIKESDIYWCTADIGWITGHSYLVYGPLALGATVFMYEGALTSPVPGRLFELIDKYNISILYTAPTAIRMFMKQGAEHPLRQSLSSLRLLGTVGEPINPEAWHWWHKYVGRGKCPIVDTWWQTETGAIMISPIPDTLTAKPGSATMPMQGIEAKVVDGNGEPMPLGESGFLVIDKPWPSIARGIYGDRHRFIETYFSRFPDRYFTGDGARQDEDGHFWILGRVDDVVNVSGHRLGTAEVESALITHPDVAESAVVARPDSITGQAIVAFVSLKAHAQANDALKDALNRCVCAQIGAFAKPKDIVFTTSLPKTRSGKIMRRVLRQIACGAQISGDLSTLEDLEALRNLSSNTHESEL